MADFSPFPNLNGSRFPGMGGNALINDDMIKK